MAKQKTCKKVTPLVIIVMIMAIVLLFGAVAAGMGILVVDKDTAADKLLPKVNEANYYSSADVTLKTQNDGNGISINVNERTGAIELDGKAEDDLTYVIGTVTLNEGTYTFTAIENASKNTVYVKATVNGVDHYFDFTGNTFDIAADETDVTLTLCVKVGTELNNVKVLPTIVEGEESGKFYE